MQRIKHTYSDPTGGGDDIRVDVPVWVTPPDYINVTDLEGEDHTFSLVEDDTDPDDPFGDGE